MRMHTNVPIHRLTSYNHPIQQSKNVFNPIPPRSFHPHSQKCIYLIFLTTFLKPFFTTSQAHTLHPPTLHCLVKSSNYPQPASVYDDYLPQHSLQTRYSDPFSRISTATKSATVRTSPQTLPNLSPPATIPSQHVRENPVSIYTDYSHGTHSPSPGSLQSTLTSCPTTCPCGKHLQFSPVYRQRILY